MITTDMFLKLEQFDNDFIQFTSLQKSLYEIESAINTYRKANIVENLRILGESGSGKSTLCELIKNKYPRLILKEQDIVPVLVVQVPPNVTINSLIDAIFSELELPVAIPGTTTRKTRQLTELCWALKIEMIVFDEAQHLYDRGQLKTHYMVADWLKSLMDKLNVPIVLVGLPNLERLLQVNAQLRRRFSKKIYLTVGNGDIDSQQSECAAIFHGLQQALPIPFQLPDKSMDEFYVRITYACDGRIAYLKKLMLSALRIAMENNLTSISQYEFELAFKEQIWLEAEKSLNPFHTDFIFRRLDRIGEPFENDAS